MSPATSKHREELSYLRWLEKELEKGNEIASLRQNVHRRILMLDNGWSDAEAANAVGDQGSHIQSDVPSSNVDQSRTPLSSFPRFWRWPEYPQHSRTSSNTITPTTKSGSQPAATSGNEDATSNAVAVLESLAWGRHYGSCYPHHNCICHVHRSRAEMVSINTDPQKMLGLYPGSLAEYGISLLETDARTLTRFHIDYIQWHHNALHGPTYLAQCELFWRQGRIEHPLWMALYLSVLSVSVWKLIYGGAYSHLPQEHRVLRSEQQKISGIA